MLRKNLNTSISIPVWQIIATALFFYVLPPPESVEIFLLSVLKYKHSVLVVKALVFAILMLFPSYLNQKSIKSLSKAKREELLLAIKNNVEAEYELHRNRVLEEEFEKVIEKESSRGFDLPQGSLNWAIVGLYKNEFSTFGNIIEKSIKSTISGINTKGIHSHLSSLAIEMLDKHNSRIKADYKRAADGYWGGKIAGFDLNESFAKIADHETKIQIDKLVSINNIIKVKT